MDITDIIVTLLIGALAGWLASRIIRSKSAGVLVNIILGLAGAFIGAYLFELLGWTNAPKGLLGTIVMATGGAVLLLFVIRLIFRQRKNK